MNALPGSRMMALVAIALLAGMLVARGSRGEELTPATIDAVDRIAPDSADSVPAAEVPAVAARPLVPAAIEAVLESPQPAGAKPALRGAAVTVAENPLEAPAKPALQSAAIETAPNWLEPAKLGRLVPAVVRDATERPPSSPAEDAEDQADATQIVRLPPVQAEPVSANSERSSLPLLANRTHPAAVIRLLPTAEMPRHSGDLTVSVPARPPLLARLQPPPIVPSNDQPLPEPDFDRAPLQPAEVLRVPGLEDPAVRVQIYPEDKPIGALTINIAPKAGLLPRNEAAGRYDAHLPPWEPRPWEETVYFWDAPAFCHRPLYYEDINLERLGYTRRPHLQPVLSGAHFAYSTLALPYNMTVHPPRECLYPLGHYRPGSPVPFQRNWPEWDPKAAAVQTGVVAGLILLIP